MPRTLLVQDLNNVLSREAWARLAECGVREALVGVPFSRLFPTGDTLSLDHFVRRMEKLAHLPLRVTVRVTWPLPEWCPAEWYPQALGPDGTRYSGRDLHCAAGRGPSLFCRPARELVELASREMLRFGLGVGVDLPGAGGGEWTQPSSHLSETDSERRRELWTLLWTADPGAVASWREWCGDAQSLPPSEVGALLKIPGALEWYASPLRAGLRHTGFAVRSAALIPKPGIYPETVAAANYLLSFLSPHEFAAELLLIPSLYGPGTSQEARTYCSLLAARFRRAGKQVGVGVEGALQMAANLPNFLPEPYTTLIVGASSLLCPDDPRYLLREALEAVRFAGRQWVDSDDCRWFRLTE